MADQATTVLIVDDQMPFRVAARSVVGVTPGFEVVGEAKSGEEAVEQVAALHPELVLMDINMDGISGIEATRRITAAHPETRSSCCRPTTPRTCPPTPARAARSATSTRSSSAPTSSSTCGRGSPRAAWGPEGQGPAAAWSPPLRARPVRVRPLASAVERDAAGDGRALARRAAHVTVPPMAPTRSLMFTKPAPLASVPLASNPAPVSRTSKLRLVSSCHTRTKAVAPSPACLPAFCSASMQQK